MPTTFVALGQVFYNYAHKHTLNSLSIGLDLQAPSHISYLGSGSYDYLFFDSDTIPHMLVHITDPYIASFELSMYGRLCKYLHLKHNSDFISDISQYWNTK